MLLLVTLLILVVLVTLVPSLDPLLSLEVLVLTVLFLVVLVDPQLQRLVIICIALDQGVKVFEHPRNQGGNPKQAKPLIHRHCVTPPPASGYSANPQPAHCRSHNSKSRNLHVPGAYTFGKGDLPKHGPTALSDDPALPT